VTLAVGARIPIEKDLSLGTVYEFPIIDREYILKDRVTANPIIES
jgi:hypothetical protein